MGSYQGAALMAQEPVVKRCTCCGRTFTRAQWEALELLGYLGVEVDDDHEIRNCPDCFSTLALSRKEKPDE